ncbi:MATE family efflux transporter [Scopulibacillus cellulosilyticus]|uniref:Probable multidrug resistance protein NorM n=1 Tax=Scopulibacillus cellulosilyticus TaxID=2665665 RepID=A0ABW2PTH8_9BACL
MYQTHSMGKKTRLLISILIPILITQLGMYAMNFFDTVMSGHASADDLAGVAIGSSLWTPIFTGLSGILLSLTPIISQLIGANKRENIPFSLMQAIYLAVVIAVAVMVIGGLVVNPILNAMDLSPQVQDIAYRYLKALAWGMIPLFVYNALRCFIDSHGQTRLTMIITLTALPINIIFNYFMIFGKMGFPRLGGVGAGYASAIAYWIITFIALFVIIYKQPFADYKVFKKLYRVSFASWKEQLKIGVPIGFSIFFETSIFSAVTLFMSKYSTIIVAAHQSAMNFASALYMIPLSISMALTIAVGFEAGAARFQDAKQYSYIGIAIAISMAIIFAIAVFLLNGQIAKLYSTDTQVRHMIKEFVIYAIFFQISDALGAPIQGILRGYKDVNITLVMTLVSYWIIGLPLGYILANFTPLEPFGYWIGLIVGLAVGAICLFIRLSVVQRRFRRLILQRKQLEC